MATSKPRSRSSSNRKRGGVSRSSANGRSASQKPEKYRFAHNLDGQESVAEREYRAYALDDSEHGSLDPDVLLDVPVVKVDSIHLQLEDLAAHVALQAKVLDLVNLNVGVDVELGKVRLDIKGVEAQALLKVRLDHVAAIVDRVLTTIDRNPELVKSLGRTVEHVGAGAGDALGETGEAVEDVGEGAGQAVEGIGQGAGQGLEGLGEGVGEAGRNVDQLVGQLAQQLGAAAGSAGEAAQGAGGALGGGGGGGGLGELGKLVAGDHSTKAKTAAKMTVKELGSAAREKVGELSERRKQRKAEDANATQKAMELADELGVDLDELDGSGADGRITVKDVRSAASG